MCIRDRPGGSQTGEEHYPETLVLEKVRKQREALFDDTVAGGMMGGYLEPHFPFYFINKRMREYLGYSSEQEFVEDIKGQITNCVHPDDEAETEHRIMEQLAHGDEYVVEYRIDVYKRQVRGRHPETVRPEKRKETN